MLRRHINTQVTGRRKIFKPKSKEKENKVNKGPKNTHILLYIHQKGAPK